MYSLRGEGGGIVGLHTLTMNIFLADPTQPGNSDTECKISWILQSRLRKLTVLLP